MGIFVFSTINSLLKEFIRKVTQWHLMAIYSVKFLNIALLLEKKQN